MLYPGHSLRGGGLTSLQKCNLCILQSHRIRLDQPLLRAEAFQRTVWHPCRTVSAPWQTWDQKALGFGWVTFRWASCIIDTFVSFVKHWTLLSSSSYNQASMPRPRFGSMSSLVNQAHIALSGLMTSIVQQGSNLARARPSSPLNPHYNRPSGYWPCVKSSLGGRYKYQQHRTRLTHQLHFSLRIFTLVSLC